MTKETPRLLFFSLARDGTVAVDPRSVIVTWQVVSEACKEVRKADVEWSSAEQTSKPFSFVGSETCALLGPSSFTLRRAELSTELSMSRSIQVFQMKVKSTKYEEVWAYGDNCRGEIKREESINKRS